MSITVLNYLDQALVDQVTNAAAERAAAEKAAKEAALAANNDFSTALDVSLGAYNTCETASKPSICPQEYDAIFEEASQTYGVPSLLLKAVAKAESGFNPNAVSSAGAIGIMQLMPQTAASLGVSNSYDPYQNIMGGASLLSQHLAKYNGNTVLALAAYNAGSGNVDKYGGVPPFAETQNYVKKVVSYMEGGFTVSSEVSTVSNATDTAAEKLAESLYTLLNARGLSQNALNLLSVLLNDSDSSAS